MKVFYGVNVNLARAFAGVDCRKKQMLCPRCNTEKPMAEFYKSQQNSGYYCKSCTKDYHKSWYATNKRATGDGNKAIKTVQKEKEMLQCLALIKQVNANRSVK